MVDARAILDELAAGGVRVTRLTGDSRDVRAGDVFVACPGAAVDARRFIPQAIAAGAAAVLWEKAGFAWNAAWTVPNLGVTGLRALVGPLAAEVAGRPSEALWIAGVTGTNGKTSTSQWIARALETRGTPTAIVGTLGIGRIDAPLDPDPNTTPDPIVLQTSLARFRDTGVEAVAMEVSSIGLDQGRANGVAFDCAIFTNLTRDHLDYHGTMEAYAAAKLRLFDCPTLTHAVVNLDDPLGVRIAAHLRGRGVHRIGYSASGTAAAVDCETLLVARGVVHSPAGLAFRLGLGDRTIAVETALVGGFNVANLLAVCGALLAHGVALDDAVALLATLPPVPGRMQRIGGGDAPSVIVDYAHTPDALEKVLHAARDLATAGGGRLTVVFGCGGDRDRGKRPLMGAVAARLADRIVVTSDNPRSERPEAIIDDIRPGLGGAAADAIVDRAAAIRHAVDAAVAGDVIVLAGKGHEPYQEIAGVRHPFADALVARAALDAARARGART